MQGETDYIWSNIYIYIYIYINVYVRGSPVENQNLTHWNLIGCSMIAVQLVLSPNSVLRPYSYHSVLITARKNSTLFKMLFLSFFLRFFK